MAKNPSNINPDFKLKQSVHYSFDECVQGLEASSFPILAYLISKAESSLSEDQQFIRRLLTEKKSKNWARKIAISGAPGVGKSSFIDSFGSYLLDQGHRIAVLPVDPSSYVSKGSILGDKTRMDRISVSEKVFIKPMSSSLALGGLAPSTAVAAKICERADFDYIILETVGVGQSEVEARDLVDMFILLLQAGGGDDLQGIKRGIMELADLFIITKADGSLLENAKQTKRDIDNANKLLKPNTFEWHADVLLHSSEEDSGNETVRASIDDYYDHMNKEDALASLRKQQESDFFERQVREKILNSVLSNEKVSENYHNLSAELKSGNIDAIEALLKFDLGLDEII